MKRLLLLLTLGLLVAPGVLASVPSTMSVQGRLLSAGNVMNGSHPATFKIYEKEEPGEPEQHCDFIFVSADLVPRVKAVRVDQKTQASDHQPVYIELG